MFPNVFENISAHILKHENETFFKQRLFSKCFENENKSKKWWEWFFFRRKLKMVESFSFLFLFLGLHNITDVFMNISKHNSPFSYTQTNLFKNVTKHNFWNGLNIVPRYSRFYFPTKNEFISETNENNTRHQLKFLFWLLNMNWNPKKEKKLEKK